MPFERFSLRISMSFSVGAITKIDFFSAKEPLIKVL